MGSIWKAYGNGAPTLGSRNWGIPRYLWPVHGQLAWSNLIHLPFLNVKTKTDLQYPNQTSALVWFYRTGSKIHNNYPIHYMRCTVVPCLKIKTTLAPEYVSYPKPSLMFCHMTVGYSWVTYGHIHSSQNITTWANPTEDVADPYHHLGAFWRIWVLSGKNMSHFYCHCLVNRDPNFMAYKYIIPYIIAVL